MVKKGTRQDAMLLRQGSYNGETDIQDHYWFDTLPFAAATVANYRFFGSGIQTGKVKQATNLQDNGKFPTGQSFVVNALAPHFVSKNGVDGPAGTSAAELVQAYYDVMEGANVDLVVTGREFDFQAPASVFLPNVAVSQESSTVGVTSISRVGDFNSRNWLSLKTPITLSELVSFHLDFSIDNNDPTVAAALALLVAGEACQLRWTLRGTLERQK